MLSRALRPSSAVFIVLSGLPASGKSTLGRALAAVLGLPLLDKDDLLEARFERDGIGDAAWRRRLSVIVDEELAARAIGLPAAVLASWWRHPGSPADSGTPTAWLRDLPGDVIEIHCVCDPGIAASRFAARNRHAGHLDGRHTAAALLDNFQAQAALGPLRIGRTLDVNTQGPPDIDALLARMTATTLA